MFSFVKKILFCSVVFAGFLILTPQTTNASTPCAVNDGGTFISDTATCNYYKDDSTGILYKKTTISTDGAFSEGTQSSSKIEKITTDSNGNTNQTTLAYIKNGQIDLGSDKPYMLQSTYATQNSDFAAYYNGKQTELPLDPTKTVVSSDGSTYKYDPGSYQYTKTDKDGNVTQLDPNDAKKELNKVVNDPTTTIKTDSQGNSSAGSSYVSGQQASATGVLNNPSQVKPAPPELSCGVTEATCWLSKAIYYVTIVPASALVWMAGWLFDKTFEITVVNLSSTLGKTSNSGFYPIIVNVWSIFRDLINMTFIFILLYAAIITILKADTSGMKKTVGAVVVAAVLINFSLFFTEVIIDISNNFAVAIHNNIIQKPGDSISAGFMDKLQLQTLMGSATPTKDGSLLGRMIIICIFGSVFLLILAVIFFMVAVLFVVRFVTFIILLMMSPVGIGGAVIPKLQETLGKNFWHDLLDQCFFAPVFMLFLWVIIRVLDAATSIGKEKMVGFSLSNTLGNGGTGKVDGTIGYWLLTFGVVIFLLIKALEISKTMSASGAKGIQEGLLKYSGANMVQSFAKSIPSRAARNTIGYGATRLADSRLGKSMLDKGFVGRMAYKGIENTSKFGFGDKKGFADKEDDSRKEKERLGNKIGELSYAEKEKSRIQEKRIKEEEEKQKKTVKEATEAQNMLAAHDAVATHATNKSDLEKQKKDAADSLKAQESYLADPKVQANPDHKAAAEKSVKAEQEKLAKVTKQIDDLDDTLIKAFENAEIKIDPNDAASVAKAQTELENKKQEMAKAQGLNPVASMKEVAETYKKAADKQTKIAEAEKEELKNIENKLDSISKERQKKYASSLTSLGFATPRSSEVAADNLRKKASKTRAETKAEKDSEEALAKLAKLVASSAGTPPTPTPPPAPPRSPTPAAGGSHAPTI